MTSLKFCVLQMLLPVNLLQSDFIYVKPSRRSKSLNKMACGDSGKNSKYVTSVGEFHPKVLAMRKSLHKYIMMELGQNWKEV